MTNITNAMNVCFHIMFVIHVMKNIDQEIRKMQWTVNSNREIQLIAKNKEIK